MILTKTGETTSAVTLAWVPPKNAAYYLFFFPTGKFSNAPAVDKNGVVKKTVSVSKANLPVDVVCVARNGAAAYVLDVGTYAEGQTPGPGPWPPSGSIDTGGRSDLVIEQKQIILPPDTSNQNNACVYVHGGSKRTTIRNVLLKGGYLCIKQYADPNQPGSCTDLTITDFDISGAGGDCIHFDGADRVIVDRGRIHSPVMGGDEHHDAIQIQAGRDYYFGPGLDIDWPVAFPNNGMMLKWDKDNRAYCYDVVIDRSKISGHATNGGLQLFVGGTIISPTITNQSGGPKLTLERPPDGRKIVLRGAATGMWANGVKRSDVWINNEGGASGPWPDFVLIDP